MVETTTDMHAAFKRLTDPDVIAQTAKIMESSKPMDIRVTTS